MGILDELLQISVEFKKTGKFIKTVVEADATDIIAIFSGLTAILFAVAMISGLVPINKATVSIVSFVAVGPALATIYKVKSRHQGRDKK